jgi:hypothetical protein
VAIGRRLIDPNEQFGRLHGQRLVPPHVWVPAIGQQARDRLARQLS